MRPFMERPDMIGHAWLGGLWFLLVVIALVVGAIVITRMLANRHGHPNGRDRSSPLSILEERFARGEIDEQEFRTRRDVLRG